ncbi:MAG: hypothetical protein KDC90_00555 [Ignavibacteriae bacterium]|nr:hypothetical protein [Ignavibacteriota bacterium]
MFEKNTYIRAFEGLPEKEIEFLEAFSDFLKTQLQRDDLDFQKLVEYGLLKSYLPENMGRQLHLLSVVYILETLAKYDGSLAWNAMTGIQSPIILSHLSEGTFQDIYKKSIDLYLTNSSADKGVAVKVKGGYMINGLWRFGSGSTHADYFMAQSVIKGTNRIISSLFKKSQVEILSDTWEVLGLKETFSYSFKVTDAFVQEDKNFEAYCDNPKPYYKVYTVPIRIHFSMHIASICLGLLSRVIGEIKNLSVNNLHKKNQKRSSEEYYIRPLIGEYVTRLDFLRIRLYEMALEVWCREVDDISNIQIQNKLRGITTYIAKECREMINRIYQFTGSESIKRTKINQCFQDINVISQHANISHSIFCDISDDYLNS